MNQERKAQIVTVVILAMGLGIAAYRKGSFQFRNTVIAEKPSMTPQDVVYAMLDAAREGDVRKYVALYTGQMESALKQVVSESSESGFSKYLKDSNAAIKGVAVNEPAPVTDTEVKLRVEYVYQDRNEVQFMYLEKAGDKWRIARVDGAERAKTLVPYGTPVQ